MAEWLHAIATVVAVSIVLWTVVDTSIRVRGDWYF